MGKFMRNECPVCCRKTWIRQVKENHQFRNGFKASIYDCMSCKARFIKPYEAGNAHEEIHRKAISNTNRKVHYSRLVSLGKECSEAFHLKQPDRYRRLLSTEKYQFVINYVSKYCTLDSKLLEVGCATGFLAGYFQLKGYHVKGIDISETAIEFCKENYGDFFLSGDIRELKDEKYDVIYHTGLIGEIDFPMEFINTCIDLLNEDGVMIFNVPNRFRLYDEYWVETVPPDLRTLFTAGSFLKLIQRQDVEVGYQYSAKGKRCNISDPVLLLRETIQDFVNYKCWIDRNQYNLYIIIKKKRK